jgi:hypothetical protein
MGKRMRFRMRSHYAMRHTASDNAVALAESGKKRQKVAKVLNRKAFWAHYCFTENRYK